MINTAKKKKNAVKVSSKNEKTKKKVKREQNSEIYLIVMFSSAFVDIVHE